MAARTSKSKSDQLAELAEQAEKDDLAEEADQAWSGPPIQPPSDKQPEMPPTPEGDSRYIYMRLGRGRVYLPYAKGTRPIQLGAFGVTPPVSTEWAKKHLLNRPRHRKHGYQWHLWTGLPISGDCKNKQFFVDKNTGREVQTCQFGNCPNHPPGQLHHSVLQAQKFLALLGTPEAIDRYVMEFDPRPLVQNFAFLVKRWREEKMQEMQGLGAVKRLVAVH